MNVNYKNYCEFFIGEEVFEKLEKLFPNYIIKDWGDFEYDPYYDNFESEIVIYCISDIMGDISTDFYIEDYNEDTKTIELYYDSFDEVSKEDFDIAVNNLSKYGWSVSNYDEVVKDL